MEISNQIRSSNFFYEVAETSNFVSGIETNARMGQ